MPDNCHPPTGDDRPQTPRKGGRIGHLAMSLIVIATGAVGAAYISQSAPKAQRRPPERTAPLVQVMTVAPGAFPVSVSAMGTVIPAHEITLKSRVAGEIRSIHPDFIEGGFIRTGETVLQIDDQDYRLALSQKKGALADALYALKLELGRQDVAKREWELINGNRPASAGDSELALRKPHLAKARADLTAAEAALRQAELDLERTTVTTPFNVLVRSTHVDLGSQVAPQEALAELVGTDAYWIQATVPVDRLRWVDIPRRPGEAGSTARVHYQNGSSRDGEVIKLLGDLEAEGRMARLLIAVKDPLGLEKDAGAAPPMLIGEYVRIEITGRTIDNAYRIPRTALRDDTTVWVARADGTLEIRPIETLWRDHESVLLVGGIDAGDRLIVSDLAAPVQGMPVRIEDGGTPPAAPPVSGT